MRYWRGWKEGEMFQLKIQHAYVQPHSQNFSSKIHLHSMDRELRMTGSLFHQLLPHLQFLYFWLVVYYISLVHCRCTVSHNFPNTMLMTCSLPCIPSSCHLSVFQKQSIVKSKQRVINMELKKEFLCFSFETEQYFILGQSFAKILFLRRFIDQDITPCEDPERMGTSLESERLSQGNLRNLPQICIIRDDRLFNLKSFLG